MDGYYIKTQRHLQQPQLNQAKSEIAHHTKKSSVVKLTFNNHNLQLHAKSEFLLSVFLKQSLKWISGGGVFLYSVSRPLLSCT